MDNFWGCKGQGNVGGNTVVSHHLGDSILELASMTAGAARTAAWHLGISLGAVICDLLHFCAREAGVRQNGQ